MKSSELRLNSDDSYIGFLNAYESFITYLACEDYRSFLALDEERVKDSLYFLLYFSKNADSEKAGFIKENSKKIEESVNYLFSLRQKLLSDLDTLENEYKRTISEKLKFYSNKKENLSKLILPEEIKLDGFKTAIEIYSNRAKTAYYYAPSFHINKNEFCLYSLFFILSFNFLEHLILYLGINPEIAFNLESGLKSLNLLEALILAGFSYTYFNDKRKYYSIIIIISASIMLLLTSFKVTLKFPFSLLFYKKENFALVKRYRFISYSFYLIKNTLLAFMFSYQLTFIKEKKRNR